jgi:hypothetical protein
MWTIDKNLVVNQSHTMMFASKKTVKTDSLSICLDKIFLYFPGKTCVVAGEVGFHE